MRFRKAQRLRVAHLGIARKLACKPRVELAQAPVEGLELVP